MSLVAIVGRPNVGKSTLFNRLVGQRKAIVDATAGTTRDRHYGKTDWNGREFSVIDTGGYTVNSEDIFDEADVILFLVEVKTGITDLDMLMADLLRRTSKKVILVCNKVDNNDQIYSSHEFYALGLGDPYCISSMSGSGTGDLMDAILAALPADDADEAEDDLPRITIVGRPNVGKSTLFKMIEGREAPDAGEIKIGPTVRLAAVDQMRDALPNDKTVFEAVSDGLDVLQVGKFSMQSRAYLGRLNFKGGAQQKLVGSLSGGERGRLHLAKTLLAGGNVLLLDEPSNDLDVETLRALEEALLEFAGCALVTSHDRWFLDRIATHILAFEGDSKVVFFDGNYNEYEADKRRRLGEEGARPKRLRFKPLKH